MKRKDPTTMHPEALILRRCYPVPVTFADLRAAYRMTYPRLVEFVGERIIRKYDRAIIIAALKHITGALDEVYAVVDGREVRVAAIEQGDMPVAWRWFSGDSRILPSRVSDLLTKADRAGYWERPHEVRLDLSPWPVSHGEVARAVLVGQGYLERLPIPAHRAMAGKTSIADAVIGHMLGDKERS